LVKADATDKQFAQCIGQTLATYIGRIESLRARVNALPKWRLRRVEEYVRMNFDRTLSLANLAKVAGLSRMHFAAQFQDADSPGVGDNRKPFICVSHDILSG
jgi:AraC family transcriptional regulator